RRSRRLRTRAGRSSGLAVFAECRAGASYRERDHSDSLRDVGDGSAQHGHRGARRPSAKSPQPRGQAIAVTSKYKLRALDLDGTIIDARLNLDPRDGEALARIISAGVDVIACTGRPFPG